MIIRRYILFNKKMWYILFELLGVYNLTQNERKVAALSLEAIATISLLEIARMNISLKLRANSNSI